MLRIQFLLFTFICSLNIIYGQLQGDGAFGNQNWMQLNSQSAKVIYHPAMLEESKRIIGIIQQMDRTSTTGVGDKKHKINIVLVPSHVVSNGYVGLAPFRSAFFSTQPQSNHILGSLNWLDLLAIHEYRHVMQYANSKSGKTRIAYTLFGEVGWAFMNSFLIPNWYFEGEAVEMETKLTSQGRGATPFFFKEQRALFLDSIRYSYQKARNGSYKDLVPDHYSLGYSLIKYGKDAYGEDYWSKVIRRTNSLVELPYAFSEATKRYGDMSTKKLYKISYDALNEKWQNELDKRSLSSTKDVFEQNENKLMQYRYPLFTSDGSLVYLKNSQAETTSIFIRSEGKEKKLCNIGYATEAFLSIQSDKLAWMERRKDPRRDLESYSIIASYDLKTGKKQYIGHKTKYFAPQFSPDGTQLVVVHSDPKDATEIHIVTASDATIIKKLSNPSFDFISFPKWSEDSKSIIYIAKKLGKLAFVKHDIASDNIDIISPWMEETMGNFCIFQSKIYFSTSLDGIDNIYELDYSDGKQALRAVSSVPVGAYMPVISPDGKQLVMSEFTSHGYRIRSMDFEPHSVAKSRNPNFDKYQFFDVPREHELLDLDDVSVYESDFEIKKYQSLFRGFRLHSWGVIANTQNPGVNIGFENILNDISGTAKLAYNRTEEGLVSSANINFGRFYPIFGLTFQDAFRNLNEETIHQSSLSPSVRIPLQFLYGNYSNSLDMEANYHYIQLRNALPSSSQESLQGIGVGMSFSSLHRLAPQDLQSKYGFVLGANYSKSIGGLKADLLESAVKIYLPGVGKTHGITLVSDNYLRGANNEFSYSSTYRFARGYKNQYFDRLHVYRFNYQLPIAYPDFGIFNTIYFKRISTRLFHDFGMFTSEQTSYSQQSSGLELVLETVVLNSLPIPLGLEISYAHDYEAFTNQKKINFRFQIAQNL